MRRVPPPPPHRAERPSPRRALVGVVTALLVVLLAVTGCTRGDGTAAPRPPRNLPPADTLLQSTATALSAGDVSHLATLGDQAAAQADLDVLVGGMGDVVPTVTVGPLTYDGDRATGELRWMWPLFPTAWEYTSTAALRLSGNSWRVDWNPSIVHPAATSRSRLEATRLKPKRGRIIGRNGRPVVEEGDILRIGLDKARVSDPAQQEASARAIAALVRIDADEYVRTVKAYGEKAFVVAYLERGTVAPPALYDIPGAMAQPDRLMLSPYKNFGGPLIGTLGEPTREAIEASGGGVVAGDIVGRSGLQAWHDKTLRGVAGLRVDLVERDGAPAPTPGAPTEVLPALVHKVDKVDGKDLTITLDVDLQTKLEGLLTNAQVKTAMAVVQPSTGKVLALAQSPNADNQPVAAWGHYPPGSTFKVVSSLALLRTGMSADSPVDCPTSVNVNGRVIQNYPGYPAGYNGRVALKDALAFSCNTAFVTSRDRYSPEALAAAAGSLGMGIDHDAGFTSFYGSVPAPANEVGFAEATFGQGTVEASPLAVAGMSASVAAGRTVVPWLVEPGPLQPTATPLAPEEGAQLQVAMKRVVEIGSATSLQGVLVGAKTGTAEFGTGPELKSHIWMTGYTANDLALTAFAEVGQYGTDLAPLIRGFLS